MPRDVSATNILRVLSDMKTERLFKTIITNKERGSQALILELGLSRRRYYVRINKLITAGLIIRYKGKYRLSSFGKVINNLQKTAEKASSICWKLETIDSIKTSNHSELADIDYMKIINILLDDNEIKDILSAKQ
ncbi:MAG: hypothetical protein GEU26_09905 [Nitrososphaeraceae archaeon]|nr:hypothetical protein [Nitrososphaeraceae archaeon]